MAKNIEYFRKRKTEQQQEQTRLTGNLAKLKQDRDVLEQQITQAIDEDRLDDVDKLTAKETDLDNRIRAVEKIIQRKAETATLNVDEIREANNSEMQKYQNRVTDLVNEALKYHQQYFETLVKAGDLVQMANGTRNEYLELAGAAGDDGSFHSVHGNHFVPSLRGDDIALVNNIRPGAAAMVYILNQ